MTAYEAEHAAPWPPRASTNILVFNNALYMLGGQGEADVWYSTDGITWNRQVEHAPWTVRSGGASVVFKNKLWIFSGKHTAGKHNWGGDVWVLTVEK